MVPYAIAALLAVPFALGHLPAVVICIAAVAAAGAVLAIVVRHHRSGHRESLAVVVGATILLATIVNDAGVAGGLFTAGYFVDAGLAAFVIAIASTPSAAHATRTSSSGARKNSNANPWLGGPLRPLRTARVASRRAARGGRRARGRSGARSEKPLWRSSPTQLLDSESSPYSREDHDTLSGLILDERRPSSESPGHGSAPVRAPCNVQALASSPGRPARIEPATPFQATPGGTSRRN